jgi:predicted ArsR family transcriptional regulator
MSMDKVKLSTKKELEIYMNPVRQQLLRQLELAKGPMTPKMLADKLGISASGVQHHIKKLMSLGLIELDHTELINGITASFYKPTYVSVQIGLGLSDNSTLQREILVQDRISKTFDGFMTQMKTAINKHPNPNIDVLRQWGDVMSGVVHLTNQESQELMNLITDYIDNHAQPATDRSPWEYAIIMYRAKEELND